MKSAWAGLTSGGLTDGGPPRARGERRTEPEGAATELVEDFAGEALSCLERVIVSPGSGVFHPTGADELSPEGAVVAVGDHVGTLAGVGFVAEVRSPFRGQFMGYLAVPGQRMRPSEPVAWLRVAGPDQH